MTRIVYERDIDQLIVGALARPHFAQFFLRLLAIQEDIDISTIRQQVRHVGCNGSIDIELITTGSTRVLIENKIDARYSVTNDGQPQPDRYRQTKAELAAKGIPSCTVLLAPSCYISVSKSSELFDFYVCYEDLLPALHKAELSVMLAAIAQANTPYRPDPNVASAEFFHAFADHVQRRWPALFVKADPNGNGVRPTGSRTIYFDTRRTLKEYSSLPRPRMSLQCWDSSAPAASAKIMIGGLAAAASTAQCPAGLRSRGGYIRRAGQSLAFTIDTPRLETQRPFGEQISQVQAALTAVAALQDWWNSSPDEVLRATRAHPKEEVK